MREIFKEEQKGDNVEVKEHWLSKISRPLFQVGLFIVSAIMVGALSYRAIQINLPLEQPPHILPITADQIKEWGTQPSVVTVGLQITDIPKFDTLQNKFMFDAKIWFLFDPESISLETIKHFSFEKAKIVSQSEPELKLFNNLLRAEFDIRVKRNTALVHSAFPFDSHRIHITLVNKDVSPREIIFKSNDSQFIISKQVFLSEWNIVSQEISTGYHEIVLDKDDPSNIMQHPKAIFSLNMNRSGLRHIFIILLPLFLICVMCMIAIGSQELIGSKVLDITIAGAASIIAYRFVIETMSPSASSFTVADYIFTFFLLVSCIQVVFSKITYECPISRSFIIARSALVILLYGIFVIMWWYLLFIWIPLLQNNNLIWKYTNDTAYECKKILQKNPPNFEVKANEFLMGSTLDLCHTNQLFSNQIKEGIELCLAQNQTINNPPFAKIIFLDDESLPLKALNNVKLLKKNEVTTLFSPVGSSTLQSYLELIKNDEISVLFPISGSSQFRSPDLSNIINFRTSFFQEGAALTKYALDQKAAGRLLFFYEESPLGLEALEGAEKILRQRNISDTHYSKVSYPKRSINFAAQEETIKSFGADTIIFFAIPTAAQELIRQLGLENIMGKNLLGSSHLNNRAFKQFCKDTGLTIITSNVVPNPYNSTIALVTEFKKHAQKQNISLSASTLEGYINTMILIHALEKTSKPITGKKIIQILEEIHNESLQGLPLNFDPDTRELSTAIWIDAGSDEWEQIDKESLQ